MILTIQWVVLVVILAVLIKSLSNLSKRKIRLPTFIFILFLLEILFVFVFIPGIVVSLANLFQIERAKDFMIYGAIAVLFYLIFITYIKIELIDREISRLVKKISLNQLK